VTDTPWQRDACSLVDAFRSHQRSPAEELEATLAAVARSKLNAFSFLDDERSLRAAAARADTDLPFGGVPIGVKELDQVAGWPNSSASVPLKDRTAAHTSTMVERLGQEGGAIRIGLTTASEFGGVNFTRTALNGVTRNPWHTDRTPGGSSGGTAAAVSGGLLTLGTAGDGGGSIRIPAGFCGLFGLKVTRGRIPRGPRAELGNFTTVIGTCSRSVRDTARWLDVTNGFDPRDPFSLPREEGWEKGLGTLGDSLRGKRVAVVDDWGGAAVAASTLTIVHDLADALTESAKLRRVDKIDSSLPKMGLAWSLSGAIGIRAELGAAWPDCADDLTPEMRSGLLFAEGRYDLEARVKIEERRVDLNEAMARVFDEVDFVIAASNPDVAFAAEGPMPRTFGDVEAGAGNNGRLTFPANLYGCPAISVPGGSVDGLPVGVQIVAPFFREDLLLELALLIERTRPWPLVAPGSPL
jgi:aspartyl-tRNA(Asn)/glutamyl-tRNA(Gln) amidotransferase subunit A